MKDTISGLFLDYYKTDLDYLQAITSNVKSPCNSICLLNYSYGVVIGKYIEKHDATMKFINSFNMKPTDVKNILIKYLRKYDRICKENEINNISMFDDSEFNNFLEKYIEKNFFIIKFDDKKHYLPFIFLYCEYKFYEENLNSPYNRDQSNIENLYRDYNIASFNKYKLVPIDSKRELLVLEEPRIYDENINKTLFIQNVPYDIVRVFSDFIKNGLIREVSFRLKNNRIFSGKYKDIILNEEIEKGKQFSLEDLNEFEVNKLYSYDYKDKLWIIIDETNITFEEICGDFETYDDMIVTQVIHLQYEKKDNDIFINHLDHEYIFYTLSEYEKRIDSHKQKGNAAQRIKSFKIDNSHIPILKPCTINNKNNTIPFIYFVLDNYFTNKDLLKEYFTKILKSD